MTHVDGATDNMLTIRAFAKPGPSPELRAEVGISAETAPDEEYALTLNDPSDVLRAVRVWLGHVLGDTAADPQTPGLGIRIRQEVVFALWRTEEDGDPDPYLQPEWWAVRMEHTALEQPEEGRLTGARRMSRTQVDELLADSHGLARVAYDDPEILRAQMSIGRNFSNMSGWTRVTFPNGHFRSNGHGAR